ncbi:MAG: FAD dependent oxidoreductase [Benjaminiella poitrasii]|nr:MAG: FAD dependent oxidoreductase [Benjaminiella poitrasii]
MSSILLKCIQHRFSSLQHATIAFQSRTLATNIPRIADAYVDNVVIGAGVVGLAIGEKLTRARPHETTFVVDKNKCIGEETSSRNSEVIHAGLYYPEDSLKTRLCIQGNRMLYDLFSHLDSPDVIPHKRIGKWIVAKDESQRRYLQGLHEKANRLGIETYFMDRPEEIRREEPLIEAVSVLVSPSTGILDSHHFMAFLEQQIEQQGGDVVLSSSVRSIQPMNDGDGYLLELSTDHHSNTSWVGSKRVFNAAGLHADKLSNMLIKDAYRLHYARGHYYTYQSRLKVSHLIYPCPERHLAGLGTHLTLDLAGRVKFGPDVEYIDRNDDYRLSDDPHKKDIFADAIQSYLPSLDKEKLQVDYSGIR